MKIIFASKFYYRRGGLEAYLFKAKELLEAKGHTVIPFSTDYFENYETEYSKYFCKYYNLGKEGFSRLPSVSNIKAVKNMFFNKEAYKNMKKLIACTKPDIVQGFGVTKHLSYSIFIAAKEAGVKTVMRLSDYALLCPNSTAIDGLGQVCSDLPCTGNDFMTILSKKCIHESIVASLLGRIEVKINLFFETYNKYVDYFIAPSQFLRDLFIKFSGISPERIIYIPVFADPSDASVTSPDENYFLYGGRLSKDKGVLTLLRAMKKDERLKLIIAGNGPLEYELKSYSEKNKLNVDFVGFKSIDELQELMRKSRALVIPSECLENSPNIVLEAYAQGKPVIGSRIGGIPELIDEDKTGLLFQAGNHEELASCMGILYDNRMMAQEMGNQGNALLKSKFNRESHYAKLEKFYDMVLKKKILIINNFYYNRGGDCTYMFSLKNLLEKKGHKITIFSMHHPQNFASESSRYFVNYINYDEELKKMSISSGMKVLRRTVYSREAIKNIRALIKNEKPDIAHIQNIHHHVTPSIFHVLKKYGVPIVWTLHDYSLICPNTSFLAHGKICEKCRKMKYYWPVITRCKKNSFGASLMAAVETITHRILGLTNLVDVLIAPSEFLCGKFVEYGFNKKQLVTLKYFTEIRPYMEEKVTGDYYLFVGRISEEKGVKTLIDAAVKINSGKLKIAGDGPLLEEMKQYAASRDHNNVIEFLGHKSRDEVTELYNKCKFLVVPSEWYETSGLIIFEAFSFGKPVIASNIGGITELVKDGVRGLFFRMGDSDDLAVKIQYLLDNPDLVSVMGKNARIFAEQELGPKIHYEKIMEVYGYASSNKKTIRQTRQDI